MAGVSSADRMSLGWFVRRDDRPGVALERRTRLRLLLFILGANAIGTLIVFALAAWAFPLPPVDDVGTVRLVNLIVIVIEVPIGLLFGTRRVLRRLSPVRAWLESDRPPTDEERRILLRAPLTIAQVQALEWLIAAVVFGILNATFSLELGQRAAITIALGGVTAAAVTYLVAERLLRAASARALELNPLDHPVAPGIGTRTLVAWAVGTGVPGLGVVLVAISTLTEEDFDADQLAVAVLALAGVALVCGLIVSRLTARAFSDPVLSVRDAMAAVERGDLDAHVTVYDGSEVGMLQAGFNEMAEGLRERERIRDLFGRQVGEEVAGVALEQEVELGGEARTVAILFCDVVGSTSIAADRDPHEVVEMLNRFFAVVVEVVRKHGGWVNKFEGDAALAVFGAPVEVDDPAARALAAARELSERLRSELDDLEAAIGVSYGEVVAGNVGEERRFEYTVIGDPVNEAARLTELAKTKPGMVLAASSAIEAASAAEGERWQLGDEVELRGRSRSTRLASPVG